MALSKIGTNSLEDLSITSGKIANDGIGPNQLDETANYAFTGTVTGAGGVMTPAFEATQNTQMNPSDATWTKGTYGSETFDSDGKYDNSTNFRFTPGVAGTYYIYQSAIFDAQGIDKFHSCNLGIYKNGSLYRQTYHDQYDNYLAYAKTPFLGTFITFNTTDYVEGFLFFNVTTGTNQRIDTGGVFGGFRIIE